MVRISRSLADVWLPTVALPVLATTAILTYLGGALDTFRGSSLAYLAWALLGVSGALGMAVFSGVRRPAMLLLRNIAFAAGIALIGFAIGLAVYANGMFAWA